MRIDQQMIQGRERLLAIPLNASLAQINVLQQLQAWAQAIGVTVTTVVIK